MKLIVGLGNPGPQYVGTRHNVGFDVVDRLAQRWGIAMTTEKFHGWFGLGTAEDGRVALLKPTTFMNRSGRAVLAAGRFYKLDVADLLVVTDDLALPVGHLRLRARGSAGSHKGLADIIRVLGTQDWTRLRIGIGEAIGDAASYVLSRFGPDEEPLLLAAYDRATEAVACWMTEGPELAMTRFNAKPP